MSKSKKFAILIGLIILAVVGILIYSRSSTKIIPPTDVKVDSSNTFTSINMPLFSYHHIGINTGPRSDDEYFVSTTNFERQLNEFKQSGYTAITFSQLINYIAGKTTLPKKPAIIIFTNGYEDNYTTAIPLLSKWGLIANFAVITGFTGQKDYLTWPQIISISSSGHEIDSHTVNHLNLSNLTKKELLSEFIVSKQTLDKMLSQNTQTLVYSGTNITTSDMKSAAEQAGYILARGLTEGTLITKTNLYNLPYRLVINSTVIN